ncbi:hypothetical protein DNTS_021571 [Danionella cerebrum]|uniref:Immunoglobulin V-set domain-containing protein n=1 Tax=Danionella cerebrum TaxID=2873325 RepID=A0A553QXX1_9TELE|nr:hypothetical protein DNTS_021571 [Danionella translucida]
MNILHLWMFTQALVSSNALSNGCTNIIINATLKSKVFLPCHFNTSLYNNTVTWSHCKEALLRIVSNNRINFDNTREGRLNVFPLVFNEGNFSVLLDDLQAQDAGVYVCEMSTECWRIIIREVPQSTNHFLNPWFYFAAGAGLFTLLFTAVCLLSKCCEENASESSAVGGVLRDGLNPIQGT